MNPYNLQALHNQCERFRNAVERIDKSRLPITLQDFPHGACGDAALLLAKYLERQGFGKFDYMLGTRDEHSHAWLQRGDLIADITADQFPDNADAVIVKLKSAWHAEFQGEIENVADFEIYDDRTRAILGAAYAEIVASI
jgi:hypothetical protein